MFSLFRNAAAIGLLALIAEVAESSTCIPDTFPDRSTNAEIIILAKIGSRSWFGQSWSIDVLEVYKGDVSFDALTSDAKISPPTFIEGEMYLIYTNAKGQIGMCSAIPVGNQPESYATVQMLRAVKAGGIPEPIESWVFHETDDLCRLSLRMIGYYSSVHFSYRLRSLDPPDERQYSYPKPGGRPMLISGAGVHPAGIAGHMNVKVYFPSGEYVVRGSGRLVVGDESWSTIRVNMNMPAAIPYEVIQEREAREVLAALSPEKRISVNWLLADIPQSVHRRFPQYPEARSDLAKAFHGDAVANFTDCLDRQVDEPQ